MDKSVEIGDFLKKGHVMYFLQENCQKVFAKKLSKTDGSGRMVL